MTKKSLDRIEVLDEVQKKGLHRLRRPVFTEILGKDKKRSLTT